VTDVVAFLRARLDEDERLATLARPEFFTPECLAVFASAGDAAHVIRHYPARVLREVEAKRAILDLYEAAAIHDDTSLGVATLRTVVKTLAAVYRDHPDYDPAGTMPAHRDAGVRPPVNATRIPVPVAFMAGQQGAGQVSENSRAFHR
jgi:Family of unknown function (DUF6221)